MAPRSEGEEVALTRSVSTLLRCAPPQQPRKIPVNVLHRCQIWSSLMQVPDGALERGLMDDAPVQVFRGVRDTYAAM